MPLFDSPWVPNKKLYIATKTKGLAEMPGLFICLFVPFGFVMVTIGIVSFPHKSIYNYMILKENLTLLQESLFFHACSPLRLQQRHKICFFLKCSANASP